MKRITLRIDDEFYAEIIQAQLNYISHYQKKISVNQLMIELFAEALCFKNSSNVGDVSDVSGVYAPLAPHEEYLPYIYEYIPTEDIEYTDEVVTTLNSFNQYHDYPPI